MSELVFLGTGTSSGLPVLGCHCEVCSSADPRDTRLRTSACVRTDSGETILLDAGPDFRIQALRAGIERTDGVLVTHAHQDHIGGLDELRQINFAMKRSIPVYGNTRALEEIRRRFDYVFRPTQEGGGKPKLDLIEVGGEFSVGKTAVLPLPVLHGDIPILGYRIGGLSYVTDASRIPEETLERMKGSEILVLNALRYEPHPTHFSLGQALETIDRIRPREAYLVHLTHHFLHARDGAKLPANVFFATDGLAIRGFQSGPVSF